MTVQIAVESPTCVVVEVQESEGVREGEAGLFKAELFQF